MIDPTLATGFATIVGLIFDFRAERRARSDDEYREFQDYLGSKRHCEIQDLLASNHGLAQAIRSVLQENHDSLIQKLSVLDNALIAISSKLDGLSDIGAYYGSRKISDQAFSILKHLYASGGSKFVRRKKGNVPGQELWIRMGHSERPIEIEDLRFLDDDLDTLVSLRLLLVKCDNNGRPVYTLTKDAADLVEAGNS